MAHSLSAKKRVRQAIARREHNVSLRSKVRTMIKKVLLPIKNKDLEAAKSAYALAVPVIDRMANKNIIHKNKAARHKSRLNSKIKALVKKA